MAWFADLGPLNYFPGSAAEILIAIGWLEHGHSFDTGAVDREVYGRLEALLQDPFQPLVSAGYHGCSICLFRPEAKGTANLFVPAGSVVYVCPELILHYMNAHHYRPPSPFCQAVLACPDTRSMEYKRMLVATGATRLLQIPSTT